MRLYMPVVGSDWGSGVTIQCFWPFACHLWTCSFRALVFPRSEVNRTEIAFGHTSLDFDMSEVSRSQLKYASFHFAKSVTSRKTCSSNRSIRCSYYLLI
jgi:hypothetical protein